MPRRAFRVPKELTVEGEAEEYGPLSVEQRGKLLASACRAAGDILRARADAQVALDYVDPLPESTQRALARLRAQFQAERMAARRA
jgi:hypothetical protein